MSNSRIIVTGSSGQLGNELKNLASLYSNFHFIFLGKEDVPVNDFSTIEKTFQKFEPSYLINCAAYTAVDKAETEKELANEINGRSVGDLALGCKQYGCRFIHLSTDYVFSGNATAPLKESDPAHPVNAYGQSKLAGEQLAMESNPDSLIIRTSWLYSVYGRNFVKTMIRLMREKESIDVVNDQYGSPTYGTDLAEAIVKIISYSQWKPGIYHFSNQGGISWFDFASQIKSLTKSNCTIHPVSTKQFPTIARRPQYAVLDTTKIQQTFSIQVKDWTESLELCIKKLEVPIS